jgi:hypothetical protein
MADGVCQPDREAAAGWLAALPDEAGRVSSWLNPDHPGFDYPEAAALWLSWVAWRRPSGPNAASRATVDAVAKRLADLLERDGAVGRGGALYLFDTAVAVDALVRASGARPERWLRGIERFVEAGAPVLPAPGGDARWSEGWGPHLIKAAGLLARTGHRAGSVSAVALAREVRRRAAVDRCGYLHALAYGAEGELMLRSLGEPAGALDPGVVATRLARLQRPDGSLPAWTDSSGPARSDTTAQAVRIWTAVDRVGFASRSGAALAFLGRCQGADGGVEYEPGGRDRNCWATVFADQAVAWSSEGAATRGWI